MLIPRIGNRPQMLGVNQQSGLRANSAGMFVPIGFPSVYFKLTMSITLEALPKTIARPKLRHAAGVSATVAPQPIAPDQPPVATTTPQP